MDSKYFVTMVLGFTPLESSTIYGGNDINKASRRVESPTIPYKRGRLKALSLLTGFTLLLAILSGCPAPVWVSKEPAVPLDPFMSSKWGDSVDEVKRAIVIDGNKWFQDRTEEPSHALYAFGTYLDHPAIFSYFFTRKSKKLYRIDVTFSDLKVYEKAKNVLIQKFKEPSHSQPDVDHWSWNNKSLIILQKNTTDVQISYSSGPFLIQNQEEEGLVRK